MLQLAIDRINEEMTGLSFIERYGGLVVTAVRKDEIGEDQSGNPLFVEKRFPVSCGVTERDCWEKGKYNFLVPDTKRKSVAYWEEIQGMKPSSREGKNGSIITLAGIARFICWLNITKLNLNYDGTQQCSIAGEVGLKVLNALDNKRFNFTSAPLLNNGFVKFDLSKQLVKDVSVFSKYTYSDVDSLMLYPNDFFAMDFDVTIKVNKYCLNELTPETPIECVTMY